MAIQLSPSVVVQERDLTNVIPAVSASAGATIIDAVWGPVLEVTTVDSENALASQFGKPQATNAASWFTAANFLSYANNLKVVRTDTSGQRNAVATQTGAVTKITLGGSAGVGSVGFGTGYTSAPILVVTAPPSGTTATAVAEINAAGSVIAVNIVEPGSGYSSNPSVNIAIGGTGGGSGATFTAEITQSGAKVNNITDYESKYSAGGTLVGQWIAKYPGQLGNSITVEMCDSAGFNTWTYKSKFSAAPLTSAYATRNSSTNDEVHVAIIDLNGKWSGTAGTVLETFAFLSKASDAKKEDGSTAYYKNVINSQSAYVWWANHPTENTSPTAGYWGRPTQGVAFSSITGTNSKDLGGGSDSLTSTNGQKMNAFELFSDAESLDVNLVMCGKADPIVASYVVSNVAEVRKDCVAFLSPQNISTGEVLSGTTSAVATGIIAYRNAITPLSSSYAVIDSGYKYQYDRYNDEYRWIPLNGDIAGLCARTDYTDDPWFSPAGLNRGQIKNVVKLAFNPRKTDRDNLYNAGVNPVASFPGQGVVLFGDKTALTKPSAFDRINVRRLFIILEKSISTAAKFQLFEFNDGFTRAQFKNIVEPFLRDVKGRRGITDFLVVCDETNNTSQVIDSNRFVADIYIKPARSINFIQLNFIATRTGASFNEIAG
jgi:hypothetical protein